MNKKKLIIFAPTPVYGAGINLVEAINMYSEKYVAEGWYIDKSTYPFYSEKQKKDWKHVIGSFENLSYVRKVLEKPDVYFFGISGRAVEMLLNLYKFYVCLPPSPLAHDEIEIFDSFAYNGETSNKTLKLERHQLLEIGIGASTAGCFPSIIELLRLVFPNVSNTQALSMLHNLLGHKKLNERLAFWWTDSLYRKDFENYNKITELYNIQTFAMLDLLRLSEKSLPLMQTYNIDAKEEKYKDFTVIHTPGHRESNKKGTDVVKKVAKKLQDIKFNIYGKNSFVPNEQLVSEKVKSHVCVDKITKDAMLGTNGVAGGPGKSALESIYAGIPTICSMQETLNERAGRYKDIPIIDVRNEEDLEKELIKLSTDKKYYNEISNKVEEWAKVLTYENTVKYLDENLYK